ncbi:bifunctional protein-serine/threonine kinase/phosphatase [Kistimonas scapharcae]
MVPALKVSIGQHTDKGPKPENQDCHGIRIPQDGLLTMKGIAVAMADGISSSEVSHVASETAVKSLLDDYYCTSEAWSVKSAVERVLTATNSWLYSQSRHGLGQYDKDKGYVCTLSALVLKHHTAHVFHVGDTRIYRLNANGLEQLTNDHRVWISREQSYLSRALGVEPYCHVDYHALRLQPDDLFIISSDGLYDFISTERLVETVQSHPADLDTAARTLVKLALEAGSDDNLSIQLVRIDGLPDATSNIRQQLESLPIPPRLSARTVFDGYTIIRELHASSRSYVYLAQDNASRKTVALKMPTIAAGSDMAHLERFLQEEWIARRISSPYVLKADLAERPRSALYTVFEYIEGQTLTQWATDNPKPDITTVRQIIEQIARGLHAFHRMEMLHQDLRPENIMLDRTGTVRIMDFGSVSVAGLQENTMETPLTHLLGTALYSAPEYFLGEPGTPQSDLFSLGVITYFLLSGHYPYGNEVAKNKTRAAQRKLVYRTVLAEDRAIPAWVDDAIRKAVHPLPERRYEELFEFTHDLRQPSRRFVNQHRPPLMERNPVMLWQGISFALGLVILYLLST